MSCRGRQEGRDLSEVRRIGCSVADPGGLAMGPVRIMSRR